MKFTTKAENWRYVGEGGAHVVFAHYSPPSTSSLSSQCDKVTELPPTGYLLRLVKQELASCMNLDVEETENVQLTIDSSYVNQEQNKKASRQLWYLRNVVAPTLGHFLDMPEVAQLDGIFAKRLYQRAQESGNIPPHRESSWLIPESNRGANMSTMDSAMTIVRGLWLRDYRRMCSHVLAPSIRESQPRLTVEIKPKAAYTACSPLVSPSRRIKYKKCRYEILHGSSSQYNPLDLFSQCIQRVQRAIQCLLDQPRNNIRLWRGTSSCTDRPQHTISEFMKGSTKEVLPKILASIVCSENAFLRCIRNLQKFDLVDSDGAIVIYDRLVHHWMGGSHDDAEDLLDLCSFDAIEDCDTESSIAQLHSRLEACPAALIWDIQETSEALNKYLDLVVELERQLENSVNEISIDGIHENAVALVNLMNRDDCVVLLRLWLLSLTMSDLSFFIGLQVDAVIENELSNLDAGTFVSKVRQGPQRMGTSLFRLGRGCLRISYEIKAIDCDQKPATKLRTRRLKEDNTFLKAGLGGPC